MNYEMTKKLYKTISTITEDDDKELIESKIDYKDNIEKIVKMLEEINLYYFDVFTFVKGLKRLIKGWHFFFTNLVVRENGNKDKAHVNVESSKRPKEGQVALFDLGYGFPKELYDKHWCYVLRDFGLTMIVVPLTSVKDNSKCNINYEIDILIKDFDVNNKISRMQVNEIRNVDVQRLDTRDIIKCYDTITSREYVFSEVNRILFNMTNVYNIYCGNNYTK